MFRANVYPSSGAQDWNFFLQHMVKCPVVVVGRGSERGNVVLRVLYEGSCLTGFLILNFSLLHVKNDGSKNILMHLFSSNAFNFADKNFVC